MQEIWKDIKGFEGLYQVSNTGKVKSLYRIKITSIGRKLPIKESILKGHKDTKGYLQVELRNGNGRNIKVIHRLVAEAFLENPYCKEQVNHIDGNKENNSVENLEWVSCAENIRHAWENGLNKARYGESHPHHILTEEQVKYIKTYYIKGDDEFGAVPISIKLGVPKSAIYNVISGKVWKSVEPCNRVCED